MKFKMNRMPLGIAPAVVAAGATLLSTFMKKDGGGGQAPSAGGPSFQQQFTPQFSPVMQQQQESPGGRQSAQPIQYATGSQTTTPGIPGQPQITPFPSPLPLSDRSSIQSDETQQYLKWGVIGLIGIAAIQAYKKRGR